MQYEKRILNALLDSYENSLLSRGENRRAVHISFPFNKKTMPAYFDESSLAYEEIHAEIRNLEQKGYLSIAWKKGREGHIVQKVILEEEQVREVYRYLSRTPKSDLQLGQMEMLRELSASCDTPAASAFISWLTERLEQGKSVKEYLNLEDAEETGRLIAGISAIEKNSEDRYIREFSARIFGDSKYLENHLGLVGKILRRFSVEYDDMETEEILAEHGIYRTPNYVYLKGMGKLTFGADNSERLDLKNLRQGIGISGEDLDTLRWVDLSRVRRVITIENLTTFFRWEEENSILIYLGGYHNRIRRKLLTDLYAALPQAQYLHFGDIDVGGFEIYLDLCRRTGIPFRTYYMSIGQLQQYGNCARELTENDRRRIDSLLEKKESAEFADVLEYMKKSGKKLEQESIIPASNEPPHASTRDALRVYMCLARADGSRGGSREEPEGRK